MQYVKAVYYHPAYLTSMQSTSWETLGWMKHKLESRLLDSEETESKWKQRPVVDMTGRNINNLSYADDTTLMAESEEELKNLLMKWKKRVKKLA